jgi:hypothetical protein
MDRWVERHCRFARVFAAAEPLRFEDERSLGEYISAEGEDPGLLGTDDVQIVGDSTPVINVEGHGQLDIPLTITDVVNSIKSYLNDSDRIAEQPNLRQWRKAFNYITKVVVGNYGPGEFGHAVSREPHTIYVNWAAMVDSVQAAVDQEISNFANQYGVLPEYTDDTIERIRIKVADQLGTWARKTVAHEVRHARDFQDILADMVNTGQGNFGRATESRAEAEERRVAGGTRWIRRAMDYQNAGSVHQEYVSLDGRFQVYVGGPYRDDTVITGASGGKFYIPAGYYAMQDKNDPKSEIHAIAKEVLDRSFRPAGAAVAV